MIPSTLSARRIGPVLSASPGGAAAIPWWLSGGVSAANAIGVYQPIGAASLAASYVNLANPGVFDAAPGVAPTWAAGTGWTFDGEESQSLSAGVSFGSAWSCIVKFSEYSIPAYRGMIGDLGLGLLIHPNDVGNTACAYAHGSVVTKSPKLSAGILAIAGPNGYRNGVLDATGLGAAAGGVVFIGRTITAYFSGNIQAVAIYNATLTGPQVLAISNAMTALT